MNIAKLLQHSSELHNPWLVIPIPPQSEARAPEITSTLKSAAHIRSTILDARRPGPIQHIIEQHAQTKSTPIGPADWGCREPNVVVSSWTNIPLYDFSFPTSKPEDFLKPLFVQVGVKVCPMLRLFGLMFDDGILTWCGEDGFWIQGNLDENLWDRIIDFGSFDTA